MVSMTGRSPGSKLLPAVPVPAVLVVVCLLAASVGRAPAEERRPSKAMPTKGRATRVFRLQNAPATDVAKALDEFLQSENLVRRATTPPVETIVVPDKLRNLVVVNCPTEMMEDVDGLIAALDARPPMISAACKLIEIGSDGKQRVLSRPQVMTLDGQAAVITVGKSVPLVRLGSDVEYMHVGHSIHLKVNLCEHDSSEADTARLDVTIHKQEVDQSGRDRVRTVKKSVQIVETIDLGQPVKLVIDKADDGSARSWMEVTVREIQSPADQKKPSTADTASRGKPQTNKIGNGRIAPSVHR